MAGANSPEASRRNVLHEFEDTRPPSDPLPKNCDCRYHIIVTNVNRKADAAHRNYRWRCGGGAAWRWAGFGLGESECWELRLRVNALGASAPLRGARTCKASGLWSQ